MTSTKRSRRTKRRSKRASSRYPATIPNLQKNKFGIFKEDAGEDDESEESEEEQEVKKQKKLKKKKKKANANDLLAMFAEDQVDKFVEASKPAKTMSKKDKQKQKDEEFKALMASMGIFAVLFTIF